MSQELNIDEKRVTLSHGDENRKQQTAVHLATHYPAVDEGSGATASREGARARVVQNVSFSELVVSGPRGQQMTDLSPPRPSCSLPSRRRTSVRGAGRQYISIVNTPASARPAWR